MVFVEHERVTFFGDIRGISAEALRHFVGETRLHINVGSYPSREPGMPEEEIAAKTHKRLAEADVSGLLPITICDSVEERAEKILADVNLRRRVRPDGQYWIIDSDPLGLMRTAEAVSAGNGSPVGILREITIIGLSRQLFDYSDKITGVRVAALSAVPYPVHPVPAA